MSTAPTPGVFSLANQYQSAFDEAYYTSRPPSFQPLYYGRPGIIIPEGLSPLTQTQFAALIAELIAAPPVNPVTGQPCPIIEQIEYWGWDPYTVMTLSAMYGNTYFPPGQGPAESTEVITPGEYSGAIPPGCNPVVTDYTKLTPWPTAAPPTPVISDLVGPQEGAGSPFYGVPAGITLPSLTQPIGSTATDSRGSFKLVLLPSPFPGFSPNVLWEKQ
jgi:hypothetical protein